MKIDAAAIERAQQQWVNRGQTRPDFATTPGPGQESVWDYPRPPAIVPDARRVLVKLNDVVIADTTDAVRVLETASPPTFYLPPGDIHLEYLLAASGTSFCEWKGAASYWTVQVKGVEASNAAWSYESPTARFAPISGYVAFYPAKVECEVGGERVEPQPGKFYGGWVTPEVIGPFKGEAGTQGW